MPCEEKLGQKHMAGLSSVLSRAFSNYMCLILTHTFESFVDKHFSKSQLYCNIHCDWSGHVNLASGEFSLALYVPFVCIFTWMLSAHFFMLEWQWLAWPLNSQSKSLPKSNFSRRDRLECRRGTKRLPFNRQILDLKENKKGIVIFFMSAIWIYPA